MPVSVAARVEWESLRHAMLSWTINSEEELSACLEGAGVQRHDPEITSLIGHKSTS